MANPPNQEYDPLYSLTPEYDPIPKPLPDPESDPTWVDLYIQLLQAKVQEVDDTLAFMKKTHSLIDKSHKHILAAYKDERRIIDTRNSWWKFDQMADRAEERLVEAEWKLGEVNESIKTKEHEQASMSSGMTGGSKPWTGVTAEAVARKDQQRKENRERLVGKIFRKSEKEK